MHVAIRTHQCGTRDAWFSLHWRPALSQKCLEVVLAATREVAAGTTVEAAAERVRAYVVDAVDEEQLEPETVVGATNESGDGKQVRKQQQKQPRRRSERSMGGNSNGGGRTRRRHGNSSRGGNVGISESKE